VLKTKNRKLILILVLAALIRFPGVWWGELHHSTHNFFEPDEHQHLSLAIETIQIFNDKLFADFQPNRLNTQGFSTQLGFIGAIVLPFVGSDYKLLLILGRFLSLFYGVLLIWVTYKIGKRIFREERMALLGALFLAISDLNVTYSHYAVPEIFHVFWAYFSIYVILNFWNKIEEETVTDSNMSRYLNLVFISMAMCLAAKYDFIPVLIFGTVMYWVLRFRPSALLRIFVITPLLLILYFQIAIYFQNETLFNSFQWLLDENKDLIGNDNHLVLNPILYLIGSIGGTSILLFGLFGLGIITKLKSMGKNYLNEPFTLSPIKVLTLFVLLEFFVLWNMDAPFVRRINIFLPYIALIAAFGLYKTFSNARIRRGVMAISIIYTFGLTMVSQSNFINDTRYEARAFLLDKELEDEKMFYCPYSKMKGLPKGVEDIEKADLVVLHEAYYGRYWKSFTTPFKIPDCCEEVYHCKSEEECLKIQEILSGKSDFQLIQKFETTDIFPERMLYKKFFGTYESFLGDVLIFQQLPQ
jgi:hypothetical protein